MLEGQAGLNWPRWKKILQTAEDSGYQSVFRSDHFIIGKAEDSLELWTSLTYAASHTQRIEFGPLVTPVTFRHPSMTVRYATAVDDLSDGRLVLGVGAGWHEDEHVRWGIPFYDFPTRYQMFQDQLAITKRLLESDEPVTYLGKHFAVREATLLPRPARAGGPPLLIGGNGAKRTLPLVAKYAQEWNAVFIDQATYKERAATLDALLADEGRAKTDVKRSLMTRIIYGNTDAEVSARLSASGEDRDALLARGCVIGTPQQIIDQLSVWVELGVQRFMLQWLELDDIAGIESMATTVLPSFHITGA
jgi:F420-dependent oxidoreductase-like protein